MTSKVAPTVEGVDNVAPPLENEFEEEETFESVLGRWNKVKKRDLWRSGYQQLTNLA